MAWREAACLTAPPDADTSAAAALDWAPALGRPRELLAAAFGRCAAVYALSSAPPGAGGALRLRCELVSVCQHPAAPFKLEFNIMGNTLACSLDGRPEVWFWMPRLADGAWHAVSRIAGAAPPAATTDGDMVD